MKKMLAALLVALASHQVFAEGVWNSLRELRGTVKEATGTAKEAQTLSKEVGIGQSANTPSSNSISLQAGDVVLGKINNLAIYKNANKESTLVVRVAKADELVFMGEESNGFLHVTSDKGEGWVEKILMRKKQ